MSIILLEGQLRFFVHQGYDVYLIAPETDEVLVFCKNEKCKLLPVKINREISVIKDIQALFQIIQHLLKVQPDIVNVGTPKMGLLGTIGAFVTGVKKRIYTCRGFRYEHESGIKKKILVLMEKITASLAHVVVCISPSVKKRGLEDNIFKEEKSVMIGKGSSNGLDLSKFCKSSIDLQRVEKLSVELGIMSRFVYGFVGRIVDRKGVKELYEAFCQVNAKYPDTFLIVVGKANLEQVRDYSLIEQMEKNTNVHLAGFQTDVPLYMSLFDVFVLPAWWEGFGNTLIQAAAMGLPVISTNVTGCKDAVKDGFNGLLIESKRVDELQEKMKLFYEDNELRNRLGRNGIQWAKEFNSEKIWFGIKEIYEKS